MLLTKKRYVGFMYESPSQTVPTWDAKVSYCNRNCAGLAVSCLRCRPTSKGDRNLVSRLTPALESLAAT